MKSLQTVGILGYGVYVPMYRIKAQEIGRMWKREGRLPIEEKSVVGLDEDTATLAVEASLNALKRAKISGSFIGAIRLGTESKPYAVKPTATIVAEAIGATPRLMAADLEFACKAGTEAIQSCRALVASGIVDYALAIGVDTAQGRPRDELEYTAGCGAAAYVLSKKSHEALAYIEDAVSYVTDTPDFWRRPLEPYPCHAYRFTGKPAYFHHIISAAKLLMEKTGLSPSDFTYAVFHQPNVKFPLTVASILGFKKDQILPGLLVNAIGNTYAASSLIGLAAVLDVAKPGDRILLVSYGSGAGSDAFSIVVQDSIEEKRELAPLVKDYINRKKYIDYATYAFYRKKILV
ncbi:MAG: hydroxymethylglutaryl-CoA synthase [Thermoprotei archaeon]|nr:MAG: hydroxymethylglutaryl-CoA synthase [Thermoprotei archaeon]RLF00156.1 MAG: hydroxymethylglutaryl-CoA synthase [Thermoprotei archaeon]HDI74999.1 hydroxymethylglutaryl-CoA synthase [Thermoprotei archaeon]